MPDYLTVDRVKLEMTEAVRAAWRELEQAIADKRTAKHG